MHLNLHTETPCHLLIRACNCNVCTLHRQHESNLKLIKIMSKRKASNGKRSKRRPDFTGAEVEVLLQNVDVSILFHYSYIHTIEFSAYLFFHCHLLVFVYITLSHLA